VVKLNLYGPKKGKNRDFWDHYSDEIGDYDDSEEDLNDGDWEDFED